MEQSQIFSALKQFQFETIENVCCGIWRGYAACVRKNVGSTYFVDLAIRTSKTSALQKAVKKALKASPRKLAKLALFTVYSISFSITFPGSENPANRFIDTMEEITSVLNANSIPPAATCALTGAANPDSLCLIAADNHVSYQPVVSRVIREQNAKVTEKVEENENNGNLVLGIIGAVLGAAVGIVVNVLLMVFAERMFALAFALVPVAAMFGYKLLKGKANKLALVIVIVLSIISVPVMSMVSAASYLAKELSMSLGDSFSMTFEYMSKNAEFRSAVFEDLPMMLLFMALGIFIAWRYMSSSLNSTQLKAGQAQLASLRPNPAYQPGAQAGGNPG